jgi:DNA-binding NarL/FixJ family response regulator
MSRTVIAAVEDMLFVAKIRATAEHLDVTLRLVRNAETLLKVARESAADLIIVDLHAEQVDPIAVAKALKSEEQVNSIRLLGFFSHVRADLQKAAVAAGYDVVIPRSVLSRDLAEILEGRSGGVNS